MSEVRKIDWEKDFYKLTRNYHIDLSKFNDVYTIDDEVYFNVVPGRNGALVHVVFLDDKENSGYFMDDDWLMEFLADNAYELEIDSPDDYIDEVAGDDGYEIPYWAEYGEPISNFVDDDSKREYYNDWKSEFFKDKELSQVLIIMALANNRIDDWYRIVIGDETKDLYFENCSEPLETKDEEDTDCILPEIDLKKIAEVLERVLQERKEKDHNL